MPENYAQGMKLLEEKDYEGALAAFKNVAEVDADYEDLPDLVKEANEEFEAQKAAEQEAIETQTAALEDRLLESARQDNAEDAVLSSLREQAERGDADAQFYLGFRYPLEDGVCLATIRRPPGGFGLRQNRERWILRSSLVACIRTEKECLKTMSEHSCGISLPHLWARSRRPRDEMI